SHTFSRMPPPPPRSTLFPYTTLFRSERVQQTEDCRPPGRIVADALKPLWRLKPKIEPILRDIDTDKNPLECHNPRVPALHVRAQTRATVRVSNGTAADQAPMRWFAATRSASEGDRSDGRRAGGACPTRSTPLLAQIATHKGEVG